MDYAWLPYQPVPTSIVPCKMQGKHEVILDACRRGYLRVVCTSLNDVPSEELKDYVEHESVYLSGEKRTPLVAAALSGHESIVQALIEEYHADIEHAGHVIFEDVLIKRATPLWCASATGRLGVVKILVQAGAHVNALTNQRSTPLRAACYDGRVDIIDYLTAHGADMRITNIYRSNCLMLAAYKGKIDAVVYFVEAGLNINRTARCGSTALFFAAQSGHLNVVSYLINQGAVFTPNNEGRTPLMIAAEYTREQVVLFFVNGLGRRFITSNNEVIDALELLGASFGTDKDNYNLEKSHEYLERAMRLRYSYSIPKFKPNIPTVPAYSNWVEAQTPQEVFSRRLDRDAMHMEALTIRERILGSNSLTVANGAIFRGAVYADQTRFDRCIDLWLHALRIRVRLRATVAKDVRRFVELFNRLLYSTANGERDLHLSIIKELIAAATLELEALMRNLGDISGIDSHFNTCFMLLVQVTRLLPKKEPGIMVHEVKREIYNMLRLNARNSTEKTLLHLASSHEQEGATNLLRMVKFPDVDLVALLLECGADANAVDNEKNTPLHLLVTFPRPLRHLFKMINIVNLLVKHGAHVDAMNYAGRTPLTTADEAMCEALFGKHLLLSLKCLAAAAASSQLTPCPCGKIPESMVPFAELHSQKSFRHGKIPRLRRVKPVVLKWGDLFII